MAHSIVKFEMNSAGRDFPASIIVTTTTDNFTQQTTKTVSLRDMSDILSELIGVVQKYEALHNE